MTAPILTVDVEDWFHVCGHRAYSDPGTWAGREKRVHVGVERILALLDGSGSAATFFVLGWIARQSPALVRRIADAGHEIACHGDLHRRVFEMTLEEFREDLRKSRDVAAGDRRSARDVLPRAGMVDEEREKPGSRGPRRGGLHAGLLAHDRAAGGRGFESGGARDARNRFGPDSGGPAAHGHVLRLPRDVGRRRVRAPHAREPRLAPRSNGPSPTASRPSSTRIPGNSTTPTRRCRASLPFSVSSTSRAARGRKGAGAACSRAIASSRSRRFGSKEGKKKRKKRFLRMGREKTKRRFLRREKRRIP